MTEEEIAQMVEQAYQQGRRHGFIEGFEEATQMHIYLDAERTPF